MLKVSKTKIVSFICALLIAITTVTSFTAIASTQAGIVSIKANGATTTIGNVSKAYKENYSSIFCKRSAGQSTSFGFYVWVKDTTNSKVLSNKKAIIVSGTSKGHWISYKSGVSYKVGDNIRFYGSQESSTSKGLSYVIYGDKAAL